jgi:hypothetical protein
LITTRLIRKPSASGRTSKSKYDDFNSSGCIVTVARPLYNLANLQIRLYLVYAIAMEQNAALHITPELFIETLYHC